MIEPKIVDRFLRHVSKTSKCWIWNGAVNNKGYGVFRINGKNYYAHRIAHEIFKGTIPDGLLVCHHCDNPPCVRPDHLFIGTISDNARDMVSKKRHSSVTHPERVPRGDRNGRRTNPDSYPAGDDHPLRRDPSLITWRGDNHWMRKRPLDVLRGTQHKRAKLTEAQIRRIRYLHSEGISQEKIAQRFNIRPSNVWYIVKRITWRHVV